jgi:hypothetical protein
MYLDLTRFKLHGKTVMGILKGDVWKCGTYFTIENYDKMPPDGTYKVKVTYSPKFKRDVPIVYNDNVPESRGIRIHEGNVVQNTKGCILVGNWAYLPNKLGNSKEAIEQLTWALTKRTDDIFLRIETCF